MAEPNTSEPAALRSAPASGGRLGRYELLQEIASGGMATVYLARAEGIGGFERTVALKCCHPHLRRDQQFASMFLDEARLAARIHHRNVVPTLDVGEDTALYFVMEYVEGVSLAEWMNGASEGLPTPVAVRIMIDALAGLHAAHELQDGSGRPMHLVHRDVSPQNILVGTDGVSRIVDFGIAKASARATVTRGGEIKGKLGYMPPEQFLGQPVGRQADIYAAGVVLWEAVAGRRLFVGESDAALMNLVLRGKAPPLADVVADVPPAVGAAVARALARKPEDRYATAAEFADALEAGGLALPGARQIGALVQTRFATFLSARRTFLDHVKTRPGPAAPSSTLPVNPAATLVRRLLDGSVLLVPRRLALWGIAAATLVGVTGAAALWWRPASPAPVGAAPAALPAPPTSPPAPAMRETAPPAVRPTAVTAPPARPRPTRKRAATATPTPASRRRPGVEYRPREL